MNAEPPICSQQAPFGSLPSLHNLQFPEPKKATTKMDEATATIERRRDQNREAQRRFRERRKQNQTNDASWRHLQQEAAGPSRVSVETTNLPPNTHVPLHEMTFDLSTSQLNQALIPTTWDDESTMTAIARAGNHNPSLQVSAGSILARSLSESSFATSSKSTESIGTHPLFTCGGSRQSGSTTSASSVDLDFWPTPKSSTTIESIGSVDFSNLDKTHYTSALHVAARKGNVNIVRILLQHGVGCNEHDNEGLTPLMHAVIEGHEEVVKGLLQNGATINSIHNVKKHSTALHLAVIHRQEAILRTLLLHCVAKEIPIDQYNEQGRTPLHEAIEFEYESAVLMLLQFGADPQCKIRKPCQGLQKLA